jgi:predicted amidohydrolase
VQAQQYWEDKDANLQHLEQLITDVHGTDLILFPEMFHTSFSMNSIELAEQMENSKGLTWLKKIAANKQAACYTSLIIEVQGYYYNRGVFVEPSGKISIYDKRKLFSLAKEDQHFSAGEQETIVHYLGWNINLQICYDLRFPENCRNSEVQGKARYDILLYVANWPEKRINHWKTLLPARAIENQCYVAAVNRVGTDLNQLSYTGESNIYDANGKTLSNHSINECIITIRISNKDLVSLRSNLPFLKDNHK